MSNNSIEHKKLAELLEVIELCYGDLVKLKTKISQIIFPVQLKWLKKNLKAILKQKKALNLKVSEVNLDNR